MLKRYSLVHVCVTRTGYVESMASFGFFSRRKAQKKMDELILGLKGSGGENSYYTSVEELEDKTLLVVHDQIHHFKIEKL